MTLSEYLRDHSNKELANALGISPVLISQWKSKYRPIPLEYVAQIEKATSGAVTRRDLRPDDWHLIWPELTAQEDCMPIQPNEKPQEKR